MELSVRKYGIWAVACMSLLAGATLGYVLASTFQSRTTGTEIMRHIAEYGNYSTMKWEVLREAYYRPASSDWSENMEAAMNPDFPPEIASEYWHLLQNAKTAFHEQTLPLRTLMERTGWDALNRFEAQFDSVFIRCVEQPYYLRLFPETYNEVMRPAITDLFQQLATDLR